MSSTHEHGLLEEILKTQKETNELLRQCLTAQHTPPYSQPQPRDGHDGAQPESTKTPSTHCHVNRSMALTLTIDDDDIYLHPTPQNNQPSYAPQWDGHDYEVLVASNNEGGEPMYVTQFYITLPPRLKLLTWHDFPLKEYSLPAVTLNRVVVLYASEVGVENLLVPWKGPTTPVDRIFQNMTPHERVVWYAISRFVSQPPTAFKIVSFRPSDKFANICPWKFIL